MGVGNLIWTPRGGAQQGIVLENWFKWPVGVGPFANFTPAEFRSRDGAETLILHERLLVGLQELRSLLGRPIHINSGYRTVAWNRHEGGTENSYHTLGMAADLVVGGIGVAELAAAAGRVKVFRDGGIGKYPKRGFVHVDVRTDGPGRWTQ